MLKFNTLLLNYGSSKTAELSQSTSGHILIFLNKSAAGWSISVKFGIWVHYGST